MALKKHGPLFWLLLALVIVVLVVGIVLVVLACLTPRQAGLANAQITQNYTVDGLGVADVKFTRILSLLKSLTVVHAQESMVTNGFAQEDGIACNAKFAISSVASADGARNYSKLFFSPSLLLSATTLKETELAYALNEALNQLYNSTEMDALADYIETIDTLKKLHGEVLEMTFYASGEKHYLKTVVRLNVSQYVEEINGKLPKGLQIADFVYCTLVNEIEVKTTSFLGFSRDGLLRLKSFVSFAVNDQPTDLSEIALDALLKATADEGKTPMNTKKISIAVSALISDFCKNIGGIGVKNGLGYKYGLDGIDFDGHTITFCPSL